MAHHERGTQGRSPAGQDTETRKTNILMATMIGEIVKTTLGPKGSEKMLIDKTGAITVTDDGATLLTKIHAVHPVVKLMVDVAKTQEEQVGDGTTTAVVLISELLKEAQALMDQGVHPAIISRGYLEAGEQLKRYLRELAKEVAISDDEMLKKLALTSLGSKMPTETAIHLCQMALEAVRRVTVIGAKGKRKVAKEYIRIVKYPGKSADESQVVHGMVLDSENRILRTSGPPTSIQGAKIAIVNATMAFRKTETKAEITISSTEKLQAFYAEEDEAINKLAKSIIDSGANIIINYKTMDDQLMHILARRHVLPVKLIPEKEIELIAKATGGKVINNINELNSSDLGTAQNVTIRKVADKEFIFIEGCKDPKAVTIMLRGASKIILEDLERCLDDAVSVLKDAVEEPSILPGGGAAEMEASGRLRNYAKTLKRREQLAINGYARALETIPKILAANAGLQPIDILLALRVEHYKGEANHGIDVRTGKLADMFASGVIEPLKVKLQAVASATETAVLILQVDDALDVTPKPRHAEK